VNTTTTGSQGNDRVAIDGAGNFVIVWADEDGEVYGQPFNASGVAQGSELLINTTFTSTQDYPIVAMSSSGSFMATWMSSAIVANNFDIYARRFSETSVLDVSPLSLTY